MDHIVRCPSCRNLIRKMFLFPPPPQPSGPAPLGNRLFVFRVRAQLLMLSWKPALSWWQRGGIWSWHLLIEPGPACSLPRTPGNPPQGSSCLGVVVTSPWGLAPVPFHGLVYLAGGGEQGLGRVECSNPTCGPLSLFC